MPRPLDRISLAALLIAAPAVVAALAVSALEGYRLARPEAFVPAPASSLAEAIQHQGVEAAYAFIRAGQDPNAPIAVTNDGRVSMVSPLTLAVESRNANTVHMLLSAGARMDLPQSRLALCRATEMGEEEILEILRQAAGAPIDCP